MDRIRNENLVIPPEIRKTMEERLILFEDIEKVIAHSGISGERFFNPEDSSYLANLRIENVTYWVQYAEKEDGIHIKNVYSHRMEVVKE
jgi:glutamate synthase (NADPH) small chain